MQQVVVGTAGHIDHGKTSLVKALTGTDTDYLPQEKSRGMTIDLGFAYLDENITIIDVPGHEKFIRNMAAGAASIHVGLLVIAADDGIMTQTMEHLDILNMMGVQVGLVALTKIDLIDDPEWIDLVELDIISLLEGSNFEGANIHRISTETGVGIESLKTDLLETVSEVNTDSKTRLFRMNVDRVFLKQGFGVIATGTVKSGTLNVNDSIECLPSHQSCHVRGIQSHGGQVNQAVKGDRAAINLTHIEKDEIHRGSVLTELAALKPTDCIIAHVKMLNRSKWKIKNKQRIRLNIGTSEILARVNIMGNPIESGEERNIYLNLETPIAVASDDLFVVRSYSPMETIAGGSVLNPTPHAWQKEKNTILDLPIKSSLRFEYWVNKNWQTPFTLQDWSIKFFVSSIHIEEWVDRFSFSIDPDSGLVFSQESVMSTSNAVLKAIQKAYEKNPLRIVIPVDTLLGEKGIHPEWGKYVIDKMVKDQLLEKNGKGVQIQGYSYKIQKGDKLDMERIMDLFTPHSFDPLSMNDIQAKSNLSPKRTNDMLHILKENQSLVQLDKHLWQQQKTNKKLFELLVNYFQSHNTLSVGEFKELTHQSRKGAIPLLEYCDKMKWTKRDGNNRFKGEELIG